MHDQPVVLMLVSDADRRERVRQELATFDVRPVAVGADRAVVALCLYRPISVLLDEGHAAVAPEAFLEAACARHVRLVTLPEPSPANQVSEAAIRHAATPIPR